VSSSNGTIAGGASLPKSHATVFIVELFGAPIVGVSDADATGTATLEVDATNILFGFLGGSFPLAAVA